jgi:putative MATE family efflux protein
VTASTLSIAEHLSAEDARVHPKLVWRLALPVIGQHVLGMIVGWSDAILAGQILIDAKYLAAGAVVGYLIWMIESFYAFIGTGTEAIVARAIGGGDRKTANQIVLQSLYLSIVLGMVMTLVVYPCADVAGRWMGAEPDSERLVAEYLRIVSLSCPMMMLTLVGVSSLRAAGHTLPGMWILSLVNIVNIFVSWTLTVGIGPIPAYGWKGIATGTSLSFVAGGLLMGWLLFRGYAEIQLPRTELLPSLESCRRILRIGIPGAANQLSVVFFHLWFVSIITRLGNSAIAAHGVAIRCESLSYLSADAFAIAAATLVGQSLGAYRPDLARAYGWTALRSSTYFLSALGVVFFTAAPLLFSIFVRPQEVDVFEQGVPVLRLVSFAMPALAAATVLSGGLRGAGATRIPLIYNVAGMLCVRIPLAYLLTDGYFHLGLYGAWIAMVLDLYLRALLATLAFLASGWTKTAV